MRQRLLLHDNEPVEVSWSYYPAVIARGTELAGRRKIVGGAARVLADNGYRPRDLHDRISARMPTTEEIEALALPPYVPVIRQFRVIRDESGRPVELSILIKGSHLHELQYRQDIPAED
ncbi:UTRA domain-containing protein [Micromonospora sp. WMMD1102]|nr:UTRA domain-containing protein [Micromonospora sp. WMMD1102]MDG4790738.1 UTRA domain-containing protein [Micromonospora sp. WMMD1102]MDG4792185.1 UTRA domain-containing protein [Micromonospora sp. WMMD1102]